MDIERIARKLEPLRPKEVRRWRRLREQVDPEDRIVLDRQLLATADRLLGDVRNSILLTLPPRRLIRGTFNLGTVLYEKEKWPAGISEAELLQNLAIFGRSGAGKTNVVFHLLQQLVERRMPFLFLDWKRTARHLMPMLKLPVRLHTAGRSISPLPFNPFIPPPGLERNVYVNQVVDVLADAYSLGDGAKSILQKAIVARFAHGNHTPTATDVLTEVVKIPGQERVRGWKISAARALESVAFANMAALNADEQQRFADRLLHENTIIELDSLAQGSKRFLIPLLCLWLYYVRLAAREREKLNFVIVVEEAHHVLYRSEQRAKESVMEMLLRQCRELGMAIIVVDQHPHLMSTAALGNTYTSICLNLKDPTDINRAAGISQVDDVDKRAFSMLPVGQAIVKLQDRWRKPFLVQFPLVAVSKGLVTNGELARLLRGHSTLSGLKRRIAAETRHLRRFRLADRMLTSDELAFLADVPTHPQGGVDERYRRLGFSADKGNRIKQELIAAGIIEAEVVPVGRTRKVLLRLTDEAQRQLGFTVEDARRGSIVHEYWKRYYADLFAKRGYDVTLEAAVGGGRVDVLACNNGENVAIEVETGKSDIVANVRRCLRAKVGRVIVVATDEQAMAQAERKLAAGGFLIPGKVELVLRERGHR